MQLKTNVPDGDYVMSVYWKPSQAGYSRREIVLVRNSFVTPIAGPMVTNDWQIEKIWSLVPFEHLVCGGCGRCLDCLRLERSEDRA
jgi:hypothetical protein